MNVKSTVFCIVALSVVALPSEAQEEDPALRVVRLVADPAHVTFEAGGSALLSITPVDEGGAPVDGVILRTFARGASYAEGRVSADQGGEHVVFATVVLPADAEAEPPVIRIPVTVTWPAVDRVEVGARTEGALYVGTALRFGAAAFHADGSPRPDAVFNWSTSDPEVATVDGYGNVTALEVGTVTIHAEIEGTRGTQEQTVGAFPAVHIEVEGGLAQARTGDVVAYAAVAYDAEGAAVRDLPVTWSVQFTPDDSIHAPAAAGIIRDGRFVGEVPGQYTIVASAGSLAGRKGIDVRPREAVREVEVVGHGTVSDVHTSDLWVYEGNDGRDYAVTGTWGGDGWAFFWDVTDPSSPMKTDSIQLDARTVNDVKVSPDARYVALSREGASNRRNGVVLLDLADPAHPVQASVYDDGLTGGVHNMFATEDHLFALSAGDKYVILDVTDIYNPTYVSEYDHPNSRIHDVWVNDGIAYSSEWGTGVVVVDVGNGRWGGSIENPVFVTNVPYPVGATHAAFPYYQEETGKFYLFLGDEIMAREGAAWSGAGLDRIPRKGGTPSVTRGYIHIIDFTDPENPLDVARYEAAEFGSHNLWVEDDVLYVAYYEGGLRAVDVSGELMGNLADQGREVAIYKAFDPNGYTANAPMAWGPQPYKGRVFFSDFNSGLWSVRIQPRRIPAS